MHQRQLAAEPQAKSTTSKTFERFPNRCDNCPLCGGIKTKKSRICNDCRYKRSPIEQPSDPTIRHIPLTKGQIAIVDADLYESLSKWKWYASWNSNAKSYYAMRDNRTLTGRVCVLMHRCVIDAPVGMLVDHINHEHTLDNRRDNLRLANPHQSQCNQGKKSSNTTGFIGVLHIKRNNTNPWCASVRINGKSKHLGYFCTAEDAAAVRDIRALKEYGEFAVLNFPERREEYLKIIRAF